MPKKTVKKSKPTVKKTASKKPTAKKIVKKFKPAVKKSSTKKPTVKKSVKKSKVVVKKSSTKKPTVKKSVKKSKPAVKKHINKKSAEKYNTSTSSPVQNLNTSPENVVSQTQVPLAPVQQQVMPQTQVPLAPVHQQAMLQQTPSTPAQQAPFDGNAQFNNGFFQNDNYANPVIANAESAPNSFVASDNPLENNLQSPKKRGFFKKIFGIKKSPKPAPTDSAPVSSSNAQVSNSTTDKNSEEHSLFKELFE
ncbi:hypothetical protein FACS189459_3560 [Bacilli bacterium]|nr:hypothetical protein FACS189459_3560 [Bacilli bacterium]